MKKINFETIQTDTRKVKCCGADDDSAHPLVYLNIGQSGQIVCPYCSCTFVLKNESNN